MKKEIIYTEYYALIVSDEEMKKGDYRLNIQKNYLFFIGIDDDPSYYNKRCDVFKKVVGHLPLKDASILEGVPLLPAFTQEEDDIEKEAKEYLKQFEGTDECVADVDFIEGYKKAKERFKYTEEDLREAFTAGLMNRYSRVGEAVAETEFIQSLQQPKRPESILLETIGDSTMINKCKNFDIETGCIALRCTCENVSKPKTTTNLQGQIELVGNYIFE